MKLNQVIAAETAVRDRLQSVKAELGTVATDPTKVKGFVKTFKKLNEDDPDVDDEQMLAQTTYGEVFEHIQETLRRYFDLTATKDYGNCVAAADITVDGVTIVEQAPPPFILFLLKQLSELRALISKMPELDPAVEWGEPDANGFRKSKTSKTQRTQKKQRAIVMYDATEHHPAQTQLISEDVVVGHWEKVEQSGAIPRREKMAIMQRIDELEVAVRKAREEANGAETRVQEVANRVFGYIFGK